tara:strand:- start:347 stop:670 length:324 start_codon:yes stop_codon:yes gene_type:complete
MNNGDRPKMNINEKPKRKYKKGGARRKQSVVPHGTQVTSRCYKVSAKPVICPKCKFKINDEPRRTGLSATERPKLTAEQNRIMNGKWKILCSANCGYIFYNIEGEKA